MNPNEERRAIEAPAPSLREAEDLAGIAWVKWAQIVRKSWTQRARQQPRMMKMTKGPG